MKSNCFVCFWVLLHFFCLQCFAGSLRPVSVIGSPSLASSGGNGDSSLPVLSADGQLVLFASSANNLAINTNDTPFSAVVPYKLNVFLRNRTNDATVLISESLVRTYGNGDSIPVGISTNNRYVFFESSASDLVANDTNTAADIFVRDMVTSSTSIVSIDTNGHAGNGFSRSACFTPDGRYVAFVSSATNLVENDTNRIADVFLRDLQTSATILVSVGATLVNGGGSSEAPAISDDGRFVAFISTATNLVSGVATRGEIYVRDVIAGTTIWASSAAAGLLQSQHGTTGAVSFNHTLSADGRFVGFHVATNFSSQGLVLRYDTQTQFTDLIHTNAFTFPTPYDEISTLDMTPDGRFMVFVANTNASSPTNTSVVVWDAQTGLSSIASGNLDNTTALAEWPSIDPTGRTVLFASHPNLYLHDLQSNLTTLVNVDTNGVGSAISRGAIPVLSQDGRLIAFQAHDGSLVANDNNRKYDLFIRDVNAGTTELISARHPGLASNTPNGSSVEFSVSETGRYVAFVSDASNLVPNDTNGVRDVFVRDLVNGTNIPVSFRTDGGSANGLANDPFISGSGRYVAFTSAASDLLPSDTNRFNDVYIYDAQTGSLSLGSAAQAGTASGNNDSAAISISDDGRYLLFRSKATTLTSGSFSGGDNLFVRDRQTLTNIALTTGGVAGAVMTADGRYVAFAGNLPTAANFHLYVWDNVLGTRIYTNTAAGVRGVSITEDGNRVAFVAHTNLFVWNRSANTVISNASVVATSRMDLQFSANGQFLTYATSRPQVANDFNSVSDVYLYDLTTQTTTLISKAAQMDAAANGSSDRARISHDGRFVVYRSSATNIVLGDNSGYPDVFIYDSSKKATALLSGLQTGQANNFSFGATFSRDGRALILPSWASNLDLSDGNQNGDLFVYAFLYVTITTSENPSEGKTISWPAIPAQSFVVQYKDEIDQEHWVNLAGTISFENGNASIQDLSLGSERRFYRVLAN